MRTPLLDRTNAPLNRLALWRIQLDNSCPYEKIETHGDEVCIFPLVGAFRVEVDGVTIYDLPGRRKVTDSLSCVLRFPEGNNFTIVPYTSGYAADMLMATMEQHESVHDGGIAANQASQAQYTAIYPHEVGDGCYARKVTEVHTPDGYRIHCGQTYSDGINGCWSSWPSHAEPEEVARYAEHEEVFWCYTEGYGLINFNGKYVTGEEAQGVRVVQHNTAFVTPLGSHEIVFSPKAESLYVWFYISFLKKTYNKYAHEGVKVYTK